MFRVLVDPTRRAVVKCPGRGELNVVEIKSGLSVSCAAMGVFLLPDQSRRPRAAGDPDGTVQPVPVGADGEA